MITVIPLKQLSLAEFSGEKQGQKSIKTAIIFWGDLNRLGIKVQNLGSFLVKKYTVNIYR